MTKHIVPFYCMQKLSLQQLLQSEIQHLLLGNASTTCQLMHINETAISTVLHRMFENKMERSRQYRTDRMHRIFVVKHRNKPEIILMRKKPLTSLRKRLNSRALHNYMPIRNHSITKTFFPNTCTFSKRAKGLR